MMQSVCGTPIYMGRHSICWLTLIWELSNGNMSNARPLMYLWNGPVFSKVCRAAWNEQQNGQKKSIWKSPTLLTYLQISVFPICRCAGILIQSTCTCPWWHWLESWSVHSVACKSGLFFTWYTRMYFLPTSCQHYAANMLSQNCINIGNIECNQLCVSAPEVIDDVGYSQQCDIWSIGVIMFTL